MAENCWEFWNCPKNDSEQCVAYKSAAGKECWMLAGHIVTEFKKCPRISNEIQDCLDCPWYKQLNENNPN